MPVKRSAESPLRSRKRARVPRLTESNQENDELPAVRRPVEEDEEDEALQDDFLEEGGYYVEEIYIPPKLSLTERPLRGERLIIERIECEDFKSYGGFKVMGPFHKSFSAIIGPNGNGKSNIIDAMLFVFGYRATKIRCKKVSVLIHKSESLPNCRSCAVTVHFLKIVDNGEGDQAELNIVPNSRITVCRRAFTNNSSAYWLNTRRVQFTEVAKFLKESGIDIVHNRFLILQGEVEQIAQMPPKANNTHETGFLEFIDEIIGTKRYEKALDQLKIKIGELEILRDDRTQRVQLAQQHKDNMKEPLEKAKVYLDNRNTMYRTNHALNQVKAYKMRNKREERSEKLKELEEKRSAVIARLDEIKQYNDEKQKEFAEVEKTYMDAHANYQEKKKIFDAADEKHSKLNTEMKASNEERKAKIKELEKAATELEKLQGLPQRHTAEIEKLEKRKAELEEDIQKEDTSTKGDLEQLNKQVEACVAEKTKADADYRKLKGVVDEKKMERDTLQKEIDRAKSNEVAENEKLSKLESELEELHEQVKRKSGTGLNVQPDTIPRMEADAKKKREEASKLTNVEYEKRSVCQTARTQYMTAKDTLEGGAITDRVDKALFGAKSQGSFPGLYGRLKDLATIDEKYNIAATAATGMLDYWVVDTDSTGAACIQFLKDQRLPAQTFVCVNKMGSFAQGCRRPFHTPKDSLRIFDLLKISKQELAPVFYKAFTNTLVAENIDIASKVAYGGSQRHRVVSCQGDIIESTGSLIGGGAKITRGRFNSEMARRLGGAMSKKQIDDLKTKFETAEHELTVVSEKRKALEEEACDLERQVQEIKSKIANYQSDLDAAKRMIPLKTKLIADQQQRLKDSTVSPKTLQEKQKKIEKINSEIEEIKEPHDEAEEYANQMLQKLKGLQENKKGEILKKLKKFKDQLKRVNQELNKLNVELRNCEKNKLKLENKQKQLTEDKEGLEKRMKEMNEERLTLQAQATELSEEVKKLQADSEAKQVIYNELKTKANEFDQEEKKLNKEKVTHDNNFQTLTAEIRTLDGSEKALIASLEKFELSDIPEVVVDPFVVLTEEQLKETNEKELEAKLAKIKQKLQQADPNLNIIQEYHNACQILIQRFDDLDEVNNRRDKVNSGFVELESRRLNEFMEGYAVISAKVKELFRLISMGGDAELDLLDSTDPFSCGIDFSVRPRGKTWKKIINLSGGEKTLSSLALVFSLHHFKPSPFYVMDEIDAALDFQNVSIIANYIKERTKFTQFIIISLRSNMFELADNLLGIYKVDNMSYSINVVVSEVLDTVKIRYNERGRPFLLGIDDHGTISSSSRGTVISTQQSTQPPLLLQATTALIPTTSTGRRPSLDVSAIIGEADLTAETDKLVVGSRTPSTATGYTSNGTSPLRVAGTSDGVGNGNGRITNLVEMKEDEEHESDRDSPDAFANSFEENKGDGPNFTSTPCVSSPPMRLRLTAANMSKVEEAANSSEELDDDSEQFFDSIGSQNNSR